jgi:hypothetical protein
MTPTEFPSRPFMMLRPEADIHHLEKSIARSLEKRRLRKKLRQQQPSLWSKLVRAFTQN